MVIINGASSVNAGARIGIRFNTDTGSNYYISGAQQQYASTYASANFTRTSGFDDRFYVGAVASSNAGEAVSGYCTISGCNSSGVKVYNGAGSGSGGNGQEGFWLGGYYNSSSTISSVSVYSSTGNLDAGQVFIYTSA
jgi:hypothetical protein